MTSYNRKQIIALHVFPNISRSKENQTKKFGQLIEYNIKKKFSENHTQNAVEKLVSALFLKNQN